MRGISVNVNRATLARKKQVCFNCLRSGHFTLKCPNKSRCMHCHRMHHSLLYLAEGEIANIIIDLALAVDDTESQKGSNASFSQSLRSLMFKPHKRKFRVRLMYFSLPHGRIFTPRKAATLKSARYSTLSFIFESLSRTLRTTRQRADLQIRCFGEDYTGHARSKVALSLTL